MRKLGKKQLTLQLQAPLTAMPAALSGLPLELRRTATSSSTGSTPRPRDRHRRAAAPAHDHGIDFKDLHTAESSLEDIFVSLVRSAPMNFHAIRAIYRFELARTWRTLVAEHRLAGDLHVALLRGVRLGHRLAHDEHRRRELRRVHRARASSCSRCSPRASPTPPSASTCRSSPARSTSCCRRRSRFTESLSATWARRPPSRSSSASSSWSRRACSCRSPSRTRCG